MSVVRVDAITEKIVATVLSESKRLEEMGRFEEALQRLEHVLSEADNETIPSSLRVIKRIAALCNRLATSSNPEKSIVKYLRTAEQVLQVVCARAKIDEEPVEEGCFRLTVLTFNNWATYHKDRKSYHMALNYLMRATKLTDSMGEILSPDTLELCAKTKLSISALYSELRRYPEAVEFAEQCLATLQLELNLRLSGKRIEDFQEKERTKFDCMIGTYIVAFYNIGAAEEAQAHAFSAIEAYRNAVTIGKRFLTTEHPVLALAVAALSEIPQDTDEADVGKQEGLSREAYKEILGERLRETQEPIEEPMLVKSRSSILSHFSSQHNLTDSRVEFEDELPPIESSVEKDGQFKYYTPEQLAKLQQRLSKGSGLNFVSADRYFYTKITKTLNVSQDVKFLRPLTA